MPHQYSTALSHLFLAGTGIFCFTRQQDTTCGLPYVAFGIIITHSILGIWRWGNPDYGGKAEMPYNHTFFLQTILALPCIAGYIYITSGYERFVGYLHPMLSTIPLATYVSDKNGTEKLVDILILLNIISCGVISYHTENHYGVCTAIAFAVNHFYVRDKEQVCDVPGRDFYNYALCFFTYFAYRASLGN